MSGQGYHNGEFNARVKDWGVKETQAKKQQAFVTLDVEFPEDGGNFYTKPMTWYGSFNAGKALEITLKALLTCGLKTGDPSIIADGPDGAGLEMNRQVRVVISLERDYKDETKMIHKISWINPVGGSAVKRMPAAQAKAQLAGLNLAGELARVKSTQEAEKAKNPPPAADDDIPF